MGSEVCVVGSCLFLWRTRGNYTDKSDSDESDILRRRSTSFRLFGGSVQLHTVVIFQGAEFQVENFSQKGGLTSV